MQILAALFLGFCALVALDFWTSHRAGLDGRKTGTTFAFPLLIALWVGAVLGAVTAGGVAP